MKYFVVLLVLTLFASNLLFAYGSVSLDRTAYPIPDVDPLELWNITDVIIDGTVIDKELIQDENMGEIFGFNIKVNEYFKGKQNAKIIYAKQLHVFPNFDLEKGDNALFYIRNASEFGYVIQSHSIKTFGNCNARDLIEISPVLPNEGFPRSAPTMSESYFDPCVADYFTYDPDFFGGILNGISPLKQTKHGMPNDMIRCYDDLHKITKYDGSPACVKPETKIKLIERGWVKDNVISTFDYELDETFGGLGNRHPAFLGHYIPDICTYDIVKFLKKNSNMFDNNVPYSHLDGPTDIGINPDDMVQCENELLEIRDKESSWKEK